MSSSSSDLHHSFDNEFAYSLGKPAWHCGFKLSPEDFIVEEELGFEPDGEGEHLLLQICKTGENTRWVAKLLADYYSVEDREIGYCGLKDRHAVTTQWFSVPVGLHKPLPDLPDLPNCTVLASSRHLRKLRPGMHAANHFSIRLRNLAVNSDVVEARLKNLAINGVPNYFGEQRFGQGRNNLTEVAKILTWEKPRFRGKRGGLYLSAARSWLFNVVLSARVERGVWNASVDDEESLDGPLWGRGRPAATGALAELEAALLEPWSEWCLALEHSGLKQERRPLVLHCQDLRWQWLEKDLQIEFALLPGCFATVVLRELAMLIEDGAVV